MTKKHNTCGVCGLSRYQARLGLIESECERRGDKHLWMY